MTAPDLATRRQIAAADPVVSTWLSANAGSGKTRVLIDRVARLLLEQVPPQNILCVTYTKAAASEMQNRLFERLGAWAMSSDETLRDSLAKLGVPSPIAGDQLTAARRLFARAIETPGGLRIQTIHAFCAMLLRRFPLEAGVSPGFRELDDRSLAEMSGEVLEEMASGTDTSALDGLAGYLSGDDLTELSRALLRNRDEFAQPMTAAEIAERLGLPPDFNENDLMREVFIGDEGELLDHLVPVFGRGSTTDKKTAETLRKARSDLATPNALQMLEKVFLFGDKTNTPFQAKIGKLPTKATQRSMDPAVLDRLNGFMARVEAARPHRLALDAARRSAALHKFAQSFLPAIQARKDEGGWLDFDDLILRTRTLLTDPAVSDWVLFKLDGRIDHILVDEAQDTSPVQWEVIQLLARELTVGSSARSDVPRTLFVVGDRKQSIYSFQGADPDEFERLRNDIGHALSDAGSTLKSENLEHSFRSAPAILNLVDAVFSAEAAQGLGGTPQHVAFRSTLPGRVDLWPEFQKQEKQETPPWYEPVDKSDPKGPEARLAESIAAEIARLIETGETIPKTDGQRARLSPGDILILVQRRSTLFDELIRACKRHNLPIAGADRLVVTRELAVRDVLALLAFLSLAEDDLSLAAVLRSPLLGWSEDALFRLAHGRKGHLWEALRTSENPAHVETLEILQDLRDQVGYLRPYDLIERILVRHRGREKLVARLGPDCEEALDAFLGTALDYEEADVPSLTGFLEWVRADAAEVKRQSESASGRIRIMTVHGAKGLEAPLVILPDCAKRQAPKGGSIVMCDGDQQSAWPAWRSSADQMPDLLSQAHADWQTRQNEERMRLLYVALTRAETWLWVCAAGDTKGSWYELVNSAMSEAGAQPHDFTIGSGLRLASGDWSAGALKHPEAQTAPRETLPDWAGQPGPPQSPSAPLLAPSKLGGAKALPGDIGLEESEALRRGNNLHKLLEVLPDYPEASWAELAPGMIGDEPDELLTEATRVLTNPDLAFLFAEGTLAEVDLTAILPSLQGRVFGTIDRLVVEEQRVLAVDFKSNAVVPQAAPLVPEGLLRQMGAYAEALAQIFENRAVETAILWTRPARLMPLPARLTSTALARALTDTSDRTAP